MECYSYPVGVIVLTKKFKFEKKKIIAGFDPQASLLCVQSTTTALLMSAQVEKIIQLGAKLTAIFDKYFIKIYFFPTPSDFYSVKGYCIRSKKELLRLGWQGIVKTGLARNC
jgi:hypothetical protein